jgi:hypothetical protein
MFGTRHPGAQAGNKTVVMVVYLRKVLLLNTSFTDFTISANARELRRSFGWDSSSRNDHIKAITANSGGVRNTIFQLEKDKIARPRKGANTGVERKMVSISDNILAI